ncbi:hypothetical protein SUGI_0573730 [Cryptomeria japonica]|nr:hypothetical protein SUGI_0573730 [Cryptomeria japonica]
MDMDIEQPEVDGRCVEEEYFTTVCDSQVEMTSEYEGGRAHCMASAICIGRGWNDAWVSNRCGHACCYFSGHFASVDYLLIEEEFMENLEAETVSSQHKELSALLFTCSDLQLAFKL